MKGRIIKKVGMVVRGPKPILLLRVKSSFLGPPSGSLFTSHIKCPKPSGNPHSRRCPVLCCSLQEVRELPANFPDDLGTINPFITPGGEAHQNRARRERVPQRKGPAVDYKKRQCH